MRLSHKEVSDTSRGSLKILTYKNELVEEVLVDETEYDANPNFKGSSSRCRN
jgi:hypothetical protein